MEGRVGRTQGKTSSFLRFEAIGFKWFQKKRIFEVFSCFRTISFAYPSLHLCVYQSSGFASYQSACWGDGVIDLNTSLSFFHVSQACQTKAKPSHKPRQNSLRQADPDLFPRYFQIFTSPQTLHQFYPIFAIWSQYTAILRGLHALRDLGPSATSR